MLQLNISSLLILIILFNSTTENKLSSSKKLKVLGLFSHPGKSHFDVFKPLLEELASRGHELTVISYFPREQTSNNSKLNNYRDISLIDRQGVLLNVVDLKMVNHNLMVHFKELFMLRDWAINSCKDSLFLPRVQDFIKSDEKFDLIITEVFNSDCFLAFADKFNAPIVALSSHVLMPWVSYRLGNSDNPNYTPLIFLGYSTSMNFYQRLINSILYPIDLVIYEFVYNWPIQSIVNQAFNRKIKPLSEIARNISAVIVNSHYSLHGAKPHLPNFIEVGGIHLSNKKKSPLPNDIKKFLDDAKEGVVFFSWGSMIRASSMPQEKLNIILRVIESIPYKVVWKWENENLPNKPNNVLIKKWLPQSAILEHPNVKCYLAHGGMLGMVEGVRAGVPMVIVPMYGDQFNNAAAAESRGVAIVLEWDELDEDNFKSAINQVINNPSYQQNAKLLKSAWHDRPESPLETAVWWCEFIGRGNGNQLLNNSIKSLSWYQVTSIDVLLFISINIYLIYWVACKCFFKRKSINADVIQKKRQ